ncbi:DUF1576 domain-containing protein [Eubacterium multiforme]|uniref:Tetrahydromethanopterin S-methyltransferase subunit F n=1 Tax=Eubacterium multiforme TaxID=83339 RepID=A0ABT9UT39_9FIRM|nr:DUF1576 domain-containing protein [Eubacterium multiforme]MDQ0149485.1 tetrahydromethanopterin S-methyltransferase subunit F [Eubacterium multiforme]
MIEKKKLFLPYKILLVIYLFFIVTAFIVNSPHEIFSGLKNIILTPDILITDYIEIGGIGATLINAALTSIISILILVFVGIKPNGSTIMALWLMTGFSFFGKNILNIWPVMLGVYLFSRYQKQPLLNYTLVMLLSTTLAPTVSQLSFTSDNLTLGLLSGSIIGVIIGFILTPIATHCISSHAGYNLYNIGFACGLLATILMSIFRALGIDFETQLVWNTDYNKFFLIFILIICIYLICVGIYFGQDKKNNLNKIKKQSGKLVSDFYILFGDTTYINMGILGIFSTLYLLLIGGDINGPTIGGIFTIIGFGCFGKHLKNIIPVMIGATLAAIFSVYKLSDPGVLLAILFSTCLAPISGKFGWKVGIIAGMLHVALVTNVGYLHGGLNLYNNGLAGGFVAMILIPTVTTFKKEVRTDEI